MSNITPSKQVMDLQVALEQRGMLVDAECWDGHKHVDLCIPNAKMYIEIDGLSHYMNPTRILADFDRDHYSDDAGFVTKRFSNQTVESYLNEIADAIASVAKVRSTPPSGPASDQTSPPAA